MPTIFLSSFFNVALAFKPASSPRSMCLSVTPMFPPALSPSSNRPVLCSGRLLRRVPFPDSSRSSLTAQYIPRPSPRQNLARYAQPDFQTFRFPKTVTCHTIPLVLTVASMCNVPRQKTQSLSLAFRLCFLLGIAIALSAQSPPHEPRFALEMQPGEGAQPIYALVPAGQDTGWLTTFFSTTLLPLPVGNASRNAQDKPCALGFEYKLEGEFISIAASLYFGELKGDFGDLNKHSHESLGNYSARLDEIVVLDAMKEFGLQPYTIKVVTAQTAPSATPVLSKVPLLQITIDGEDRTSFHLVVHNLSTRPVRGIVIERGTQNERSGLTSYEDLKALIEAGGSYKLPMANNKLDCESPDGTASEPVPCPIVLEGALFADGAHAGDPSVVAGLELARSRTSGPRRQLRELLQVTVNDPALSDAERIAQLRAEIPNLPEKADPALDELRASYPELSDEQWERIKTQNNNLFAEKHMVLQALDRYEDFSQSSSNTVSLAQSLRRWGLID